MRMAVARSILLLLSSTASLWFGETLVVFPPAVAETKGSNLTLYCRENNMVQAQGILWRAPGGTVYDPADAASSSAAGARISAVAYTLAVTMLQSSDGGTYRCERKSNQSDYATGSIQVTVLPYIANPVSLQQIVLGQNATIRCQYNADASPTPTVYWYRKNRQVNDSRLTIVPGGLVIAGVMSSDEGNYTCVVLSSVGSASLVITAVFRAPPQFVAVTASSSVLIQKGDTATLDCSAVGVPAPVYTWSVPPTVNPVGVSSNTMIINAGDFSATGVYSCTAFNSLGSVNRSFDVFVFAPPYPSAYIHSPITVQPGQPVVLNCLVVAMPPPTYAWFLYNSQNYQTYPIDHLNVAINGSTLTVLSIDSRPTWFMCLVSNAYGESRHYFHLDTTPSSLSVPLPSSLLVAPTKEALPSAVQGLDAGGSKFVPVVVGTVSGAVLLMTVIITALVLYLTRSCRRKISVEQQQSLEQSMRSTLSSTSEQSTLIFRQTPSLPPVYNRLKLSSTSSQTSAPMALGSYPSVDEEDDDGVFVETMNPAFQDVNPALQNVIPIFSEVGSVLPTRQSTLQNATPIFQNVNTVIVEANPITRGMSPVLRAANPLYMEGTLSEANHIHEVNPAYLKVNSTHQEAQAALMNSTAQEIPTNPVYAEVLNEVTPISGQSIYETIH